MTSPIKTYRNALAFLFSLAILEYIVFAGSFSEFFQGDALFWLQHRFRTWPEFFRSLFKLDVAHWYRPLSNRTIPALFFHWFGLNPYGYHWVVFILFFAATCIVFAFLYSLTSSLPAALFGTLFFAIHSINVYVTYDFAFAPELFYASFYLLSCIAFIRRRYSLSIFLFILALMSKEAAVTLPGILVLLVLLLPDRLDKTLKWTVAFFAVFAIYYAIIVHTFKVGAGDYSIGLNKEILPRLVYSFHWAFNFMGRQTVIATPLKIATLVVLVTAFGLLFTKRRRFVLLGIAWFIAALSPMLGIVGAFASYYLFLPLVGIALVVGLSFEWLYTTLRGFNQRAAVAVTCLLILPFLISARVNAQTDLPENTALAYAGRIAKQSALDLKASHPVIPHGATLFILNKDEPELWRWFGLDSLIKLIYADDSVDVLYSSLGHTVSTDLLRSDNLIVMKYENNHMTDVTLPFKANPNAFLQPRTEQEFEYTTSNRLTFEVFPHNVVAGIDSYTIRISGAGNMDAELQYKFNEGPLAFTAIHLNPAGETKFFVSTETKLGKYRFVAFRIPPEQKWIKVSEVVAVTDR